MSTIVAVALTCCLFAICALREVTPDARTPAELVARARALGWLFLPSVLRCVAVAVLLVLVEAARLCCQATRLAGAGLLLLAFHVERVGRSREVGWA
ncbi:hypothetical protein ACIBEJ_35295 [Nonomuraea sp. NPDC050790]|uniref:hypothetical protein n=1 Tax=Nonomuraea sp. NPDC050790 TaxID=3364371 RepID=UPI00378E4C5D